MMKKFLALIVIGSLGYFAYTEKEVVLKYWEVFQQGQTDNEKVEEVEFTSEKRTPLPPRPKKSLRFQKQYLIAKRIPKSETRTIEKLGDYIQKTTNIELEKAQIIYSWIALNIRYDDKGYNSGKYGGLTTTQLLKSKKGVCDDFSSLFKDLCTASGLKSIKIIGYAKAYGYTIGHKMEETDHAWNAVEIDGKWNLVDVTWGRGYGTTVNGKLKSVSEFDDYWFCTSPYEFIFRHLPENRKYQNLPHPITKEQYEQLEYISLGLFQLGFPEKKIFNRLISDSKKTSPEGWKADIDLIVKKAPLNGTVFIDQEFKVKIFCPENVSIAIVNNGDWTYLEKKGDYFEGSIRPKKGELTVNYQLKGYDKNYLTLLRYKVIKSSGSSKEPS